MSEIRPESEADLAEAIRAAKGPLAIRGGGTRSQPTVRTVLSTAALSGISLYEPGALTLVARAGTPLAEVEAALAERGQRLAFEPMDHRAITGSTGVPTIGGVIATNASGPRRVAAGAARDFLLGVTFFDGAGTRIRNGGRVMKNVTGYDLARLHCGARGTLGVLTEVALKVLPAPERTATLALHAATPKDAVGAMARALGSPFEISGAAWDGARVLLRLEGFAASVEYRAAALAGLLDGLHPVHDDPWPGIRDGAALATQPGDIWRANLRASHGATLAERLHAAGGTVVLDWGGALVWAEVAPEIDVRGMMADLGGHATLMRGIGCGPRRHPDPEPLARIAAGLRAKFDPRGIFAEEG